MSSFILVMWVACIFFFLCVSNLVLADMQEPATKHVYLSKYDDQDKLTLAGVGVRVKSFGPIKANVYSAALYVDRSGLLSRLRSQSTDELDEHLVHPSVAKSVVLRMARDVSTDTMVTALADSVKPRIGSDTKPVHEFQTLLSTGLQGNKVKSGMSFRFETKGNGRLKVVVDEQTQGEVASESLVRAFFGVYLDRQTVSPALRESVTSVVRTWTTK